MIEQRISERKAVNLEAEIFAGTNRYKGVIENISSDGLYIQFVTDSEKNAKDFYPANLVSVSVKLPSGEEVDLKCESRWINIDFKSPGNFMTQLGIKIIDPSQKLKDFVDSLP